MEPTSIKGLDHAEPFVMFKPFQLFTVFSMRVKCDNCDNTYNMKPIQNGRKGSFKLCYFCRQNPPPEYVCLGKIKSGEKCRSIRMFDSAFCHRHRQGAWTGNDITSESADFTLEEIQGILSRNNALLDELNEKYSLAEDEDKKEEISSWVVHYVQENCHLIELLHGFEGGSD